MNQINQPKRGLKAFLHWFTYKESIVVCVLAAAILAIHLVYISNPPEFNTSNNPPTRNYIGDETFYVPEANLFLHEQGMQRPEHVPLGKWLIAGGIYFFGDNPVGWRIAPIIFAEISIFLFYFLAVKLVRRHYPDPLDEESERPGGWSANWLRPATFVPLMATFLFVTENLSFVLGHIAMLDVFSVTFMLLGLLLYLRGNYTACGFVLGLAMLSKAMALLAVLVPLMHLIFTRRNEFAAEIKSIWNLVRGKKEPFTAQSELIKVIKIVAAVSITWFVLLPLLEFPATHHWADPIQRTIYMLHTHMSLNDASYGSPTGIASNPWSWLIWPAGITYWFNPRYLCAIGWTIWAMIIPSNVYLIWEIFKYRTKRQEVPVFLFIWFFGVYGLLVALKLITGRLMYHFYFYPAVPAVCLATAWLAWRMQVMTLRGHKTRVLFWASLSVFLVATLVTFIFMSPLGTGLITLP